MATEGVAVTARTVRDREALWNELAVIRERGYATSHGESENGIGSIGVAIRDATGEPRAAMSVALPLDRWTDAIEHKAAAALRTTAAALGPHL